MVTVGFDYVSFVGDMRSYFGVYCGSFGALWLRGGACYVCTVGTTNKTGTIESYFVTNWHHYNSVLFTNEQSR